MRIAMLTPRWTPLARNPEPKRIRADFRCQPRRKELRSSCSGLERRSRNWKNSIIHCDGRPRATMGDGRRQREVKSNGDDARSGATCYGGAFTHHRVESRPTTTRTKEIPSARSLRHRSERDSVSDSLHRIRPCTLRRRLVDLSGRLAAVPAPNRMVFLNVRPQKMAELWSSRFQSEATIGGFDASPCYTQGVILKHVTTLREVSE